MQLQRYAGNPILSPHPAHSWEDLAVFNPAAWYDEEAGEVLLLYRAAESGPEYKCYFGLAKSRDGYHFERVSDEPVLSPSAEGFDGATIQDPRMIKMDGWYYVTYAARHYPFGQFWIPEVRKKYITPTECPAGFPRYLRINATLTCKIFASCFSSSKGSKTLFCVAVSMFSIGPHTRFSVPVSSPDGVENWCENE
jgi:predicted GH43/DUF377 family glycosyl hydrolase